jgi:hypothetical protein
MKEHKIILIAMQTGTVPWHSLTYAKYSVIQKGGYITELRNKFNQNSRTIIFCNRIYWRCDTGTIGGVLKGFVVPTVGVIVTTTPADGLRLAKGTNERRWQVELAIQDYEKKAGFETFYEPDLHEW